MKMHSHDDCRACPLVQQELTQEPSRRAFFQQLTAGVAGVLALGLTTHPAFAISAEPLVALGTYGKTLSYAIPTADGAQIDKDNEVILVRWLNSVYAFALSCPHQHTSLAWLKDESRFQCPKHRSQYAPDGYFISGRATRGMDRYAIKRDGNNVVVDLTTLYQETEQKAAWEAATIEL